MASCIGRSSCLNVVAFREDRNDYSVQKRGKQAQVGGSALLGCGPNIEAESKELQHLASTAYITRTSVRVPPWPGQCRQCLESFDCLPSPPQGANLL